MYLKADKDLEYSKVLDATDIASEERRARGRADQRPEAGHDVARSPATPRRRASALEGSQ